MLEHTGVITRSLSPWASPVVIVPKKLAPGEPLSPEKDVRGFQTAEQKAPRHTQHLRR